MTKLSNDILFRLIKTLGKNEKRYLRVSLLNNKHTYAKLFDLVDRQSKYDQDAILSQEKSIKKSQIANLKKYLFDLILQNLRLYHRNTSIDSIIYNGLLDIETLYNKGLLKPSIAILNRIKHLATKYENFTLQLIINEKEKKLGLNDNSKINKIDILTFYDKQNKLISKLKKKLDYIKLEDLFSLFYFNQNLIISDDNKKELEEIIDQVKEPIGEKRENIQLMLSYYWVTTRYYNMIGEYDQFFAQSKRYVAYIQSNLNTFNMLPTEIMNAYNTMLISSNALKKYSISLKYIDLLKKVPAKSSILKAQLTLITLVQEIDLYIKWGRFELALSRIPLLSKNYDTYQQYIANPLSFLLPYYFNTSYTYFALGMYSDALLWINKILNLNYRAYLANWQCKVRVLHLIVNYELDNIHIQSILRSTNAFLKKKRKVFKIEAALMKFISLPNKNNIDALTSFQKQMERILQNPEEKLAVEGIGILEWVEAKIARQPFAKFVQKKVEAAIG